MLVGDDGPETVSLPATAGPDLTERSQRIDLTRVAAEASGSMLLDDDQLDEWETDLTTLLSTGLTDEEADAELDRISTETAERARPGRGATAVHVHADRPLEPAALEPPQQRRRGAAVVVRASSPKLTFPEGDQTVVLIPAAVTEVVIPVEARTNGTSAIGIEVLTPAFDQPVLEPVVLTARVNALTGLGQVVTGGAIVVLLSWWYGHFRRGRRHRLAALAALEAHDELGAEVSPDAAEVVAVPGPDPDDHR